MKALHWPVKIFSFAIISIIITSILIFNFTTRNTNNFSKESEQKTPAFYDELLKKGIENLPTNHSGILLPYGTSESTFRPKFEPNEVLISVQAVPFLLDVLENGPNWKEDKKLSSDIYPHLARCYAAKCLGIIGDYRAFKPLVNTLENGTYLEEEYKKYDYRKNFIISNYAAAALGNLGDPCAVEPLIRAMMEGKCYEMAAIESLGKLRDIRAIKPIIDYVSTQKYLDFRIEIVLQSLSGLWFDNRPSYPELDGLGIGNRPSLSNIRFWQVWWEHKDDIAKKIFDTYYPRLKEYQKKGNGTGITNMKKNMIQGGIPTLPYLIDAIEKGDKSLIPTTAELIGSRRYGKSSGLSKTPTKTEILKWWKKNKDNWALADPNTIEQK